MPKRATTKLKGQAAEGTAMPPRRLAPPALPPIHTGPEQRSVAPWPINDRWPSVIGQAINFQYLSSVFRLSSTGYRQQLVDLLNELLEMDAHLFSVMQKRILSTANGRVDIKPVELEESDPDFKKAKEVADHVREEIARIPNLVQALATLLWGLYYAVSAAEIFWTKDDDGWHPVRLEFVHSRRLAYPDAASWDLYVWDQGMVYGWQSPWGSSPTNSGVYGTRIADWPGKFIVFTPGMRGDYPTREGLGRQVAAWALFKRIGARGGSEYLERFAKPFMDVSWATFDEQPDGTRVAPRAATDDDIDEAKAVGQAVGPGSGSGWAHPDSIKLEPKTVDGSNSAKLTWGEWLHICNAEISKAVTGGTLGTDAGKGSGGNRALGEVQERAEADLEQFDGNILGETLKRDLITWIVRLNRPDCMHLIPNCTVHVEVDPDPKFLIECATQLTSIGAPVDVDALSEDCGIRLTPNETGKPRRSFMSDVITPDLIDDDLMSDEAKQAAQDDKDTQNELAKAKAKQPVMAPGQSAATSKAPKGAKKAAPAGNDDPKEKAKGKKLRDTILMSDRGDKKVAGEVFEQLIGDYPAESLGWVLSGHWEGPQQVPIEDIDFASRARWRASHEPIEPYVENIRAGHMKPVVMVKTPGNPKLVIVDGHHRTLAYEQLGWSVIAYVAEVHVDEGPWDELHDSQTKGSSKGSASWLESQQRNTAPSYRDDVAE